jgi:hypothetical protein
VDEHKERSLTMITETTIEYAGENTYRDLLDVDYTINRAIPKYGPSRFDPILPSMKGRSNEISLNANTILDDREIKWRVYADNAPENKGVIKLNEIAVSNKYE